MKKWPARIRHRLIDREATRWVVRLQMSKNIEALWPKFQSWLAKNPEHSIAHIKRESECKALDVLKAVADNKKTRD